MCLELRNRFVPVCRLLREFFRQILPLYVDLQGRKLVTIVEDVL